MAQHREQIERLTLEHGLLGCFECGKCNGTCPLYELFEDLDWNASPRGIVEAALAERDLTEGEAIWFCLGCDACTEGCPCGVEIRDFIGAVREICMAEGRDEHVVRCRACDAPFMPGTTLAKVLERTNESGAETPELLLHCPRCRAREYAGRVKATLAPPADGGGFFERKP